MLFIKSLLPLAALTRGFVIPDEGMTEQLLQAQREPQSILDQFRGNAEKALTTLEGKFGDIVAFSGNTFDAAINAASNPAQKASSGCHQAFEKWDIKGWLDSSVTNMAFDFDEKTDHPHKKPKHPHHGDGGHGKPNLTVYQLIAGSKYTTKLAKLINEYPDLVKTLNGTAANYTVFAPTDKAFEKIPHHGDHKPSKELIEKVLSYHVSPEFYPAGRILLSHTIPTALEESFGPQRLRVGLGLRGLAINIYSKVIAVNIFGTNGVIHAIDSLLIPPPPALKIIELLPGEFSTLQLGLVKTGLFSAISKAPHSGGTLFAPTNLAFKKLGPRINAFLFSSYGEKYLKAVLKYHVVANQTLYSDAFYKAKGKEETEDVPSRFFHVDLPTLLKEKSLSIDVGRWGGWITIKINGFNSVALQDGIAKDGVVHVLSSILIPPKTPGGAAYMGEEMSVEEFKDRFDSYIPEL